MGITTCTDICICKHRNEDETKSNYYTQIYIKSKMKYLLSLAFPLGIK